MSVTNRQPLPSVMADLTTERATGSLVATSDGVIREIRFTNGEIRAARSQIEDEKLGMWLATREKITEDDRALILLAQGGGDSPPLGQLLVTRRYITREELETELEELALAIVQRASAAPRTTVEFVDGGGEGQLDTMPNVVTSQIILLAARAVTDIESIRTAIGSPDKTVRLSGKLAHMLQDVELTPTEGFLISRLDAANDVAGLVSMSSLPEAETYSTLYALMMSGSVIIGDGEAAEPAVEEPLPVGPARTRPLDSMLAEEIDPDQDDFSESQLEERRLILKRADEVTRVDHYRALDLEPDADPKDVVEAWERIERDYAPETSRAHLRDMEVHLARIVERGRAAFEVLSEYRARKRYDKILQSIEQSGVVKKRVVDPKARLNLVEENLKRANELIKQNELYLAIQLLEQACFIQPRPEELLKLAGLLQQNPLWINRALACMRRAIEADPKYVDAWLTLADFWRRRKHLERQRKSLERALAIEPDNEEAKRMYKDLAGNRELQRLLSRARQMRT
jgi:tetratricopeptide (TPR) repeat protein